MPESRRTHVKRKWKSCVSAVIRIRREALEHYDGVPQLPTTEPVSHPEQCARATRPTRDRRARRAMDRRHSGSTARTVYHTLLRFAFVSAPMVFVEKGIAVGAGNVRGDSNAIAQWRGVVRQRGRRVEPAINPVFAHGVGRVRVLRQTTCRRD